MKRASRFMPKYEPKDSSMSLWGWLSTIVIVGFCIYLIYDKPYVLPMILSGGLYIIYRERKYRQKMSDLASKRKEAGLCHFAREFDCHKIDTRVIRAVYEQIQSYLNIPGFSIRAEDDLFSDLEIDAEDFDFDIVEEIAYRTGRGLDNIELNPFYGNLNKVKDLVFFFNAQPLTSTVQ